MYATHGKKKTLYRSIQTELVQSRRSLMGNPIVSIIIPTRNRPSLLRHCLEHVLAQPYPHKELIVVDSSSNDES